jgi:hypothetical protein
MRPEVSTLVVAAIMDAVASMRPEVSMLAAAGIMDAVVSMLPEASTLVVDMVARMRAGVLTCAVDIRALSGKVYAVFHPESAPK